VSDYTTRRGTRRATTPARDPYRIPTRDREDDGAVFVLGGDHTPICPDCRRGRLLWAEAGYVPWHRICETCGSHWDLHPLTYIDWGQGHADEPADMPPSLRERRPQWTGDDPDGHIAAVETLDPDDRLPAGVTHAELLRLAVAAGTQPNGGREDQRVAHACWARRARFYR